jgi:cell division protein FtsL
MKKPVLIIIFLIGLIVVLSVTKAIVYNRLSTLGIYLGKVEQQTNFYKTQNAILLEKVLTESSLTNIIEKAQELGFAKENVLMVVRTSRPLAVKR